MGKYKVVIDKEGYKSITFIENGELYFWDDIGGHSVGSKEYLSECKTIQDSEYLKKYFSLYNIKVKKTKLN